MEFKPSLPIYMQIVDEIKKKLMNSLLEPGAKIASVRELALVYGVNPNTVQRALAQLEQEGILFSERTAGRFISKDEKIIKKMKDKFVSNQIDSFIKEIKELGLDDEEIIEGIKGRLEHGKHS